MPEPVPLPSDSIILRSPAPSRTTWNSSGKAPVVSVSVPALFELFGSDEVGVYKPPVIEFCAQPPAVSSSSTPEVIVPFDAVNVPTTAVALGVGLLLSYPENRNAYVPLTRDATSEALAIVQYLGLGEQPV